MIGVKEPLQEYPWPPLGDSGSLGDPDGRITLAKGVGSQALNGLAETLPTGTPVHEQVVDPPESRWVLEADLPA